MIDTDCDTARKDAARDQAVDDMYARIAGDALSTPGALEAVYDVLRAAAVGDPRRPHVVLASHLPANSLAAAYLKRDVVDILTGWVVAISSAGDGGPSAFLDQIVDGLILLNEPAVPDTEWSPADD